MLAAVVLETESSIAAVASESSVSILAVVSRRPSLQPSPSPPSMATVHPTTPFSAPSAMPMARSSSRESAASVLPVLIWALIGTGALVLMIGIVKLFQSRCNKTGHNLNPAENVSTVEEGSPRTDSASFPEVIKSASPGVSSLILSRLPTNTPASERPGKESQGTTFSIKL